MAEVLVMLNHAVVVDYYGRKIAGPYKVVGYASRADLGIGGGPIYPPEGGGGGESPPGIWGPPGPWPTPPIANVPGLPPTQNPPGWGLRPEHPIVLPPEQVPPGLQPPEPPPPGTTTPVPPPEGQAGWPVNPMVPPAYMVFNYPGYGPIYITPPAAAEAPAPTGRRG